MSVTQPTLPPFDELAQLAKNDPDAFTALKKTLCDQAIAASSATMRPRLHAQQSRLDKVIAQCHNPNHVNVVLNQELHQQLAKLQQSLQGSSSQPCATIVPFQAKVEPCEHKKDQGNESP